MAGGAIYIAYCLLGDHMPDISDVINGDEGPPTAEVHITNVAGDTVDKESPL